MTDPMVQRLRTLFADSPVGMAFARLEGEVLAVNRALCDMLGRTEEELLQATHGDLLAANDRVDSTATRRALDDGTLQDVRVERRFLRPDGSIVWGDISARMVHSGNGEPDYMQVVVVDITARKLAEEAQARLAAIVQSSYDAIIGIGDGVITSWNRSAERIFGYAAEEVLGTRGEFLLLPAERSGGSELLRRVQAGERVEEHHAQRMRKDGTTVNVSLTVSPIRDQSGSITGVATVIRDLSEQERTERQAAIVTSSGDAIIATTLDGDITSWNRAAQSLYGYAESEVLGRSIDALVPPEGLTAEVEMRAAVAGGATIPPYRTTRVHRSGRSVHVSVSASPIADVDGRVTGISRIARDITDVVEAEDARRAAEARMQAVLENAPVGLSAYDDAGVMTYIQVGRSLGEGFGPQGLVGRSIDELFTAYPGHADRMRRVLAGEAMTAEVEAYGRILDVRYSPLRDQAGNPDGIVTVAVDVTERVRAEREREEIERRLRRSERLQSLGQLAGGVAHDFNNLLAVILNYAQFVVEGATEESVRRDAEEIRKAAERAARLTRQLLIFGRQDSVDAEILDINGVVSDMHSLLQRTLGEHIELVVHTDSSAPPVRADRGRMEQILVNLAVNARDAMRNGGTLTIETGAVVIDDEQASTQRDVQPGAYARLMVSDTGTGMSAEVIAHAFEPFFTTKPKGFGTGLGLATVYGIVSAAGGHVGIYSENGLGTTIRVHLPVADEEAIAAADTALPAPHQSSGETLLVLEDDDAVRTVTVRMLRRNGYRVLEAGTAEEALALAASNEFALLLTDVLMPQMSGREVAERIRQRRPGVPVVYMSGYSEGVLGPQGELAPGLTLIQKPFDERTLVAGVAAAIHGDAGSSPHTAQDIGG
ncbi:MAG TPA: PAS domain S-box protein [Candidatus Dormibacteraeota bacterium]|nr:PAS domain S-box protein [Candidatus Dormibacteraeota bacterium]